MPFVTAWSGQNNFEDLPVALYGIVLLMSAIAYYILTMAIISTHGKDSLLAKAVGRDYKGKISIVLYAISIPIAYYNSFISLIIFMLVAVMWLIPDLRIEKEMLSENE